MPITPEYCVKHELKVRPVYKLATSPTSIPVSGIGGITSALGYAIINVQIPGIPSYDEEQVALVIQDVSGLGMRVPVILGTPTIYRLCRTDEGDRNKLCAQGMAARLVLLRSGAGHISTIHGC